MDEVQDPRDPDRREDDPTASGGTGADVDGGESAPDAGVAEHGSSGAGDGAAEVAAAAQARGMPARPVRTDHLLDGEVQHVIVEPPSDPGVVPMVVGALALAAVLGVVAVVAGLTDATILQGISLGGALLLVAVALVLAAAKLLPEELVVQQRHETSRPTSTAPAVDTAPLVQRRPILLALGAALAAVGTALIVPARGIGPGADESLRETAWRSGARAIDEFGELVRAEAVPLYGIVTIWPEGARGDAQSATVLLRLAPAVLSSGTMEHATDEGLVAYSKICTHAGCAISQFSADDRPPYTSYQLVCPCHQSTFDVTEQAEPVGGPATRPLAQLPVGVDDDGVVIATGDFLEPPGPAWWSR